MEALKSNARQLRDQGYVAEAHEFDIADRESVERLSGAYPDTDILINVSGTNTRQHFAEYSLEEYERIMTVNLHGIARLTQRVGDRMVKRGAGGKIVMIGSITSMLGLPS